MSIQGVPTRIRLCPDCKREVQKVRFFYQKSYDCTSCCKLGPWNHAISVRNPANPKKRKKKYLTDESGEVRELTKEDFKKFKPISERLKEKLLK